jgi:methylglutaconyl-CoA hydratase
VKPFFHIRLEHSGVVRTLALLRPDVRNAFNAEMIFEVTDALRELSQLNDHRVLVIAADGPMFCAGADFHWMGSLADASFEENQEDSRRLFDMFNTLYNYPRPTLARVQGGAYGGGAGLIACCDLAVMAEHAQIAFSEVRLGLVPSAISPFVIRKIGEGHSRELFLTGMTISAGRAYEIGLVNKIEPVETLDQEVQAYIRQLLSCGPQSQTVVKELLRDVPGKDLSTAKEFTARIIAAQRVTEEGQEGMRAFLEKRKPKFNLS